MTVVPVAFQLTSWIPAWWGGAVGGDDIVSLMGSVDLPALRELRGDTLGMGAYCPALSVSVLPGPRSVTEAAVEGGQAVILHRMAGPSAVLVPDAAGWSCLEANPSRPSALTVDQAATELAEAVVGAEHALRETGGWATAAPRSAAIRSLPPDADPARRALLTRAVRVWNAVEALGPAGRGPLLEQVRTAAARATLASYAEPLTTMRDRTSDRRYA
jgi:hypothetical protein